MMSRRATPRDLARRMAAQAPALATEGTAARAMAAQFAPRPVDDQVEPREGLCAFDANGMNEVEGRK